jgi:hypothetical protein
MPPTMGFWTALLYAIIVLSGYTLQIAKIAKTHSVEGVSGVSFMLFLAGITVRLSALGFIYFETQNLSALILMFADIGMIIGNIVIIVMYVLIKKSIWKGASS